MKQLDNRGPQKVLSWQQSNKSLSRTSRTTGVAVTCVDSCAPCLSLSKSRSESSAPLTGGSPQPSTTVCERLKPQPQTSSDILFTGQLKLPWDGITDNRNSYPWSRKIRSHTMSFSPAGFNQRVVHSFSQ